MIDRDEKQWNDFVKYLTSLPEEHKFISQKENFGKMSKRWGRAWIDYLNASYTAWVNGGEENEEEFKFYNGIPDNYFPKLKQIEYV